MEINKILQGDSLEVLKTLPDESVNCCITSPPYWGLRDYGVEGQMGQEDTPEQFVETMMILFREVRRVLKDNGTLWLDIGDTYNAMQGSGYPGTGQVNLNVKNVKQIINRKKDRTTDRWGGGQVGVKNLPAKNLLGIPWHLAFALQKDGWYLRQDIIWSKPNPMPESVTDRCTKAHEYIFLLSKSARYYFDNESIKEKTLTFDDSDRDRDATRLNNTPGRTRMAGLKTNHYEMKNKRSVWEIATKPFSEAHFATFPEELIAPMIKAGCPENGIVLDPFMGAGTTAVVAKKLGRNWLGIDLNPEYIQIARKRIEKTPQNLFQKLSPTPLDGYPEQE